MGGRGLDVLAREPVRGPLGVNGIAGGEEEVVGRVEMACGDDDVEVGMLPGTAGCGFRDGLQVGDGGFGEAAQLVYIGGDPADLGLEVVFKPLHALSREQGVS